MSDILNQARLVQREYFNPELARHVESLRVFLATGNWGDVQFYPEVPFIEVPMTVMMKYLRFTLHVQHETAAETSARLREKGVLSNTPRAVIDSAASLQKANELLTAMLQKN